MSHAIEIFVRADGDLLTFANEVGRLLGAELTFYQHEAPYPISLYKKYDPYYYGSVPGGFVDVCENPLKSRPYDRPFDKYQFEISLRGDHPFDPVARERWLYDYS